LDAASEPVSWTYLGSTKRVLGQIYYKQGQVSEGEEFLMESAEHLRKHGTRYELARTYLALGTAIRMDEKRCDEAKEALEKAHVIFQELGAKLDLERMDELDSWLESGKPSQVEKRSEGDD
jgi:tetratricopeptide (TPR) repeat protein